MKIPWYALCNFHYLHHASIDDSRCQTRENVHELVLIDTPTLQRDELVCLGLHGLA